LLAISGLLLRADFISGKWLYTPVTVWEQQTGAAALVRSRQLIERLGGSLGRAFPFFVFVLINAAILMITLSWSLLRHFQSGGHWQSSIVEITACALGMLLSLVLCTMLSPLIGIGYALFYLKARKAGGENLDDLLIKLRDEKHG
jgi:hypothetical protein